MNRWKMQEAAHAAVAKEIREGRLVRPDTCQDCGAKPPPHVWGKRVVTPIEAHHTNGYENPLEVVFVCKRCHTRRHSEDGTWARRGVAISKSLRERLGRSA